MPLERTTPIIMQHGNFDSDYDNSYQESNYVSDTEEQREEDPRRRSGLNWVLIVFLFLIGVLGLWAIWYLCSQNKRMKAHYEDYIRNSRDSVVLVVTNLNANIERLENEKTQLSGQIRVKDRSIYRLNQRLKKLLAEYDPEKYKKALANIKDLEEHIASLEDDLTILREENLRLFDANKVLMDQVDDWKGKYDDLYQSYLACCKERPIDAEGRRSVTDDDDPLGVGYIVTAENLALTFQALDKKGNVIENAKKMKISDIRNFLINFDAKSTKATDHIFYVRVTDSIQGNLVVPFDYAETGKKILKLPDDEEITYTYSLANNFTQANVQQQIATSFDPYFKQIRYLSYRVEIYDSTGKLCEGYARPSAKKGRRRRVKAQWIW